MRDIVYEVTAFTKIPAIRDAFLDWLGQGHVQTVLESGARNAMVTAYESDGTYSAQARFVFPSREAFDGYEASAAIRLRGEMRRIFEEDKGLRVERRLGTLAFRLP